MYLNYSHIENTLPVTHDSNKLDFLNHEKKTLPAKCTRAEDFDNLFSSECSFAKELEIHSLWVHFKDEVLIKATPDLQLYLGFSPDRNSLKHRASVHSQEDFPRDGGSVPLQCVFSHVFLRMRNN